jgi:hypothetical protein
MKPGNILAYDKLNLFVIDDSLQSFRDGAGPEAFICHQVNPRSSAKYPVYSHDLAMAECPLVFPSPHASIFAQHLYSLDPSTPNYLCRFLTVPPKCHYRGPKTLRATPSEFTHSSKSPAMPHLSVFFNIGASLASSTIYSLVYLRSVCSCSQKKKRSELVCNIL